MTSIKINLSDIEFANINWSGKRVSKKAKTSYSDLYPIVNGSTCQLGKLHRTYKSDIDQELLLSLTVSKFIHSKIRKNKDIDLDNIYEFRLLKKYFKVLAVRQILIAGYDVFIEGCLEKSDDKNIYQLGQYLIKLEKVKDSELNKSS